MKKVSDNILLRVYVLFGLFLLFGGILMLRIMGLQLNEAYWIEKESEKKIAWKRVVADRGSILAEDGTIMATSLPFYRLAMDPTVIDTTETIHLRDSIYILASKLATYFGEFIPDSTSSIVLDTVNMKIDSVWTYFERKDTMLYYQRILKAIQEQDRHIYLTRKKLNFKELQMVKTWPILSRGRYRGGLLVEKLNNERFYPFGSLAKATLGSIVQDTLPVRGVEYSFHSALRGRDSYVLAQKIVGGGELPLTQYGETVAIDGQDVVTTIDVNLQDIVSVALQFGVERAQAKFGTAILLEVGTGKIKALANFPENFNHGIATQIEPGSTFKLISATAVLEDQLIDICDSIDTGDGKIDYAEQQITDNGAAYGMIDFEQVFARSSNVGVSKLINQSYGQTPLRFLAHLRKFGFFEVANTQIIGEPEPKIYQPGDKLWNSTTLPSMAIGYSLHVTPLQMATFYNAIANGGKMMRPWLVKEIRDNSKLIQTYGPEETKARICSPETIEKIAVLLKAVVTYGTAAKALKDMPFPVAGKTGTAKKFKYGKYRNAYRASFGGFFPADNPRYTCYIMVDEPIAGGYGGGSIAAPIFRQIAEQVYTMDMELTKPEKDEDAEPAKQPLAPIMYTETAKRLYEAFGIPMSQLPDTSWVAASSAENQISFETIKEEASVVPNVKGMNVRDALVLLENMGLKVRLSGTGRVKRQSLLPGYRIGKGSLKSIILYLG